MLKALLEKRAALIDEMNALVNGAEADDRDLSDDEQAQFETLKAEHAAIEKRIARADDVSTLTATATQPRNSTRNIAGADIANAPGAAAPAAAREFESLGEFMVTIARNRDDQRLAAMYHERKADQRMDDGPSGGFAVPTQFVGEMLRVEAQDAMFRPRARVIPAGSPPDAAVTMPALDQDTGATGTSARGGVKTTWIGEGAQKPKTDAKLRQITLEPKEVAATLEVTDKLLRNWQAAGPVLQGLMRDAVIAAEEDAFLNGNGIAKPMGLINAPATVTVSRGASGITYANLTAMLGKLLMRGGTPIWTASQSELTTLMRIKDDEGNFIWQPNAREGVPQTLLGYPLLWNEFSPLADAKGSLALANLSYYLIKDGSGPFVAASEHVKFEENKTVFKVFWNVDGQPWLTKPFKQEKGYEVSPFIVLGAA
ncbi:phage major capsid protein [uncultured Brevundimonas sp.]|uniref:phage major capsid protein n=1 Tax=uncultured Brevundimonas sp. TaxID=213418 RepID=UPI0030EC0FE4|tara:strand:+ start:14987 stop:16267 length:1281 start_codon:yes stop_codon:yes gene_type:complete